MKCKCVAVLLAGTSESNDALSEKINDSSQQRPRYRETANHCFKTSDFNSKYKLQVTKTVFLLVNTKTVTPIKSA